MKKKKKKKSRPKISIPRMSPLLPNINHINFPPHFTPPRLIHSHASNLFLRTSKHLECPSSRSPPPPLTLNQSVAAIVFGDGPHWGLYPLTKRRSEAALPIAGNYRLVDAVMSNCINSNITKIYALTQFNSASLNSHLSRAYSRARVGRDGFVEVVAACQSPEGKGWFQGTADAIRRCLWILEEYPVAELLLLPGYHLYKMDYRKLIESHRNSNADITVAVSTNATPRHNNGGDSDFGYFHVNTENRVTSFRDKPETRGTRNPRTDNMDGSFPSMGIYVVSRDTMIKLLTEYLPMANDLRSEVIPVAISLDMKVNAYKFDGYWEDMRNIEAYYRANLESTKKTSNAYNFNDTDSPLYTLPHRLPPSIITDSVITDSSIAGGCILNRCKIKGTVVGMRTRVGEGAVLEDSIVLGSDKYEMVAMEDDALRIPVGIGECSRIKKAILDKNVRIGKNVKIVNRDNVEEGSNEAKGYIISKGIVVILRGAVIPDGSIV